MAVELMKGQSCHASGQVKEIGDGRVSEKGEY